MRKWKYAPQAKCLVKFVSKNYQRDFWLQIAYTLDCNVFLGFIILKISNKHKLHSLSNTLLLFYQPFPFWGGKSTIFRFFENKQNSNPHPLCNVGEIKPWLIKTTCFSYLVLQIMMEIITQAFNFKFENVSFTKLPIKIYQW